MSKKRMLSQVLEAFKKLDTVLEARAPSIYHSLLPGAEYSDLARLRSEFGGEFPFLEAWFTWHNGASMQPTYFLPLGLMISISEAIEDRRLTGPVGGFRRQAVKILEDGSGDGYFMDVSLPDCRIYYHMLEGSLPVYYGDLTEFAGFIAQGFELGILFEDQNGMFDYQEEIYDGFERNYLSRIGVAE